MPLNPAILEQYDMVRQKGAYFDLSDRTKIEITGADRASFLHNLCTNDIKKLKADQGCEAFLCNAKGKILAHFWVFCMKESLWLDAAPGFGRKIVDHLRRYVVTEAVEITDRTAELRQFMSCETEAQCEKEGVKIEPDRLMQGDVNELGVDMYLRRWDMPNLYCRHWIGPEDVLDEVRNNMWRVGLECAERRVLEILRVEAGMPEYGQDIDESNYPQEVGRDAQTISFTKGCYLGQEPIVMIRDRGQVSRLLVGLKLPGAEPAAPGTQLTHDGKEIGKITSSVWSPLMNGPIALGYVRRGLTEPGTKVQVAGTNTEAVVTKLPFAAG